jgi:hypothetical protein
VDQQSERGQPFEHGRHVKDDAEYGGNVPASGYHPVRRCGYRGLGEVRRNQRPQQQPSRLFIFPRQQGESEQAVPHDEQHVEEQVQIQPDRERAELSCGGSPRI